MDLNKLFPEDYAAYQRGKGQDILNQGAELALKQAKEADEVAQMAKKANPYIARAITLSKIGDTSGATDAINRAYEHIPNGGKFEMVDTPTGKQFKLTRLDGSSSTMPANMQTLSENIAELSTALDPKNAIQTWTKARQEAEDFNKKQMQSPQRDAKGNVFYTIFKDGRTVAVDETGKELPSIPKSVEWTEGREKHKASIKNVESGTAVNQANANKTNKEASWVDAEKQAGIDRDNAATEASKATTAKVNREMTAEPTEASDEDTLKVIDKFATTIGAPSDGPLRMNTDSMNSLKTNLAGMGKTARFRKTDDDEFEYTGYTSQKVHMEGDEAYIRNPQGQRVLGIYKGGKWQPKQGDVQAQAPDEPQRKEEAQPQTPPIGKWKINRLAARLNNSSKPELTRAQYLKQYGKENLAKIEQQAEVRKAGNGKNKIPLWDTNFGKMEVDLGALDTGNQ